MSFSSPKAKNKYRPMAVERLYQLIHSSPEEVSRILKEIDKYYYEKLELKLNKKTGLPKLKDGKPIFRTIRPSKGKLKLIQKKLQKYVLSKIKMPIYIQGSVKNKSNITNAAAHFGNKYFFLTDLKNFFPSISNEMVYKSLCLKGFSPDVSSIITKLTTYKGNVPQGISTSSFIANLAFLKVDYELINLISQKEITYTRYVDDLTFSSKNDFKELDQTILKLIIKHGFKISHKKTNYKTKEPNITGVIMNKNKMTVAQNLKDKLQDPLLSEMQKAAIKSYINQVEGFLKRKKNQLPKI